MQDRTAIDEPTKRAIVIDDNLMFAMMIEPQLKRLGYAARTLSAPAVAEIVAAAPGVVFVNLTSTRFSGPDLVRALRSQPELAETGIVGYAGHVERAFFQAGREAGADLVVPNSAVRASLPEILEKLTHRRDAEDAEKTEEREHGWE